MLIKNYKQLATTKTRRQLLKIIEAGIKAVLPSQIMPTVLSYNKRKKILQIKLTLPNGKHINELYKIKGRIFVVGGGKATGLMAESLEKIIPVKDITAGIVNCVNNKYKTNKIKVVKANHPTPDMNGVKGVKQMLALQEKYNINTNDLVLCLISGGGSSLLPLPAQNITLKDIQKITKLLLICGAEIHEINCVRKHLSKVKGGQLAKFFAPAKILSLIISDVVGNDLDTIASGITAPDKTTWQDVYYILKKYKLLSQVPKNIIKLVLAGKIPETPKKLINCDNYIIANNLIALKAAAKQAKKLKLSASIITDKQIGDTQKVATNIAKKIISNKYKNQVIILGGETTPTLPQKHGMGGRNQHFTATTILTLKNLKKNYTMASIGTDGIDYIPQAAGAIIDQQTLNKIQDKKINIEKYINNFDSYNLFRKLNNSLIKMDNTGTNVGDVIVYIIDKKKNLK